MKKTNKKFTKKKNNNRTYIILTTVVIAAAAMLYGVYLFVQSTTKSAQTPCYSYSAPNSQTTTRNCDAQSLVNGGGYYPINVLWYGVNTSGSFESAIAGLEAELNKSYTNVSKTNITLDGVNAVRFSYGVTQKANVTRIDASTNTTSDPLGVFIMADTTSLNLKVDGSNVSGVSIQSGQVTQAQQNELNSILKSWRWKK